MDSDKRFQAPKIVMPHERGPVWLRLALLLSIVLGAGWLGYQIGGGPDLSSGLNSFKPLADKRMRDLEAERDELNRQLQRVQQEAQMDQIALSAIKEQIKQIQDERLEMEEELTFLRGIVSGGSNKTGLRVQKFKLEPDLEEGWYHFQFSVSQVLNSGEEAKGRINLRLEGLRGDQAVVLDLKELTEDNTRHLKMQFRFFQNVEGKLKLPADFTPAKLIIELVPEDKKLDKVTAIYDWPQ